MGFILFEGLFGGIRFGIIDFMVIFYYIKDVVFDVNVGDFIVFKVEIILNK